MRLSFFRMSLVAACGGMIMGSACAPTYTGRPRPQGVSGISVRIGLAENASAITIESAAQMRLTVGPAMVYGKRFRISAASGEVLIRGPEGEARGRKVLCESSVPIRVNGTAYRGAIEVLSRPGGLTVVNVVGVEDYLRGVIAREIGYLSRGELEAMRAQAIAARTYTLARLGRRSAHGFDLYDDEMDQVYGGVDAESDLADEAVETTRGEVITYQGKLIEAYFHSTCGGSTANIEDVWDLPPVPYLRRVYDADERGFYCEDSPHFRWVEVYTAEQARRIISAHLAEVVPDAPADVGRLREVVVESQAMSGRALLTRIRSERGTWYVSKDDIRRVLRRPVEGEPPLRTSYIRLFNDRTPDGFLRRLVISGGGNGHGLGMCQWGAITMARRGYTAEQILTHYYTGVEIVKLSPQALARRDEGGALR